MEEDPGVLSNTESWNGTSWTEVADLATARRSGASGRNTKLLYIAGKGTVLLQSTEEWTVPESVTNLGNDRLI